MAMPPLVAPLRRLVPIQPRPLAANGGDDITTPARAQALASVAAKDAKRRKHRLAVKRAYHEKLNGLNSLREQEKTLQKEYDQLLRQSRQPDAEPETETDPQKARKNLYVKLLEVRRSLERENTALREITMQHEHFQTRLRLAAEAEGAFAVQDDDDDSGSSSDGSATLSAVIKMPPATPVVIIEPITLAKCFEVIHQTWPQVLAFMQSRNNFQLGSEVFGWTHKYRIPPPPTNSIEGSGLPTNGHKLQYSISKTFPGITAFELSQKGWEIMTTPRLYKALHSSSMTSQLHLIQRVDNDNMVFLRILKRANQTTVFKTLCLMSQFQVHKGVLTIFRGLDPTLVTKFDEEETVPSNVVWLEMFSWTYFEDQADGRSVKFEFGGEMRHTSNDNARFWMMEVLLMALRWETMAVGPLFTLTDV